MTDRSSLLAWVAALLLAITGWLGPWWPYPPRVPPPPWAASPP